MNARKRLRLRALAGVVVLAVLAVSASGASGRALPSPRVLDRSHREAAAAETKALLDLVALPPGTQPSMTEPAGDDGKLAKFALGSTYGRPFADAHTFWVTAEPIAAVSAYVLSQPPPSASPFVSSGSIDGVVTGFTDAFSLRETDVDVLGARWISAVIVPLADGLTGVRVDAQVQWNVAQPLSERIPRTAGVLDVTDGVPGRRAALTRRFTRPEQIRRVAAAINELPVAQHIDCTGGLVGPGTPPPPPQVVFKFRASSTGPVLATVEDELANPTDTNGCTQVGVIVRGHNQPGLWAGGRVLGTAERVLGIRLPGVHALT